MGWRSSGWRCNKEIRVCAGFSFRFSCSCWRCAQVLLCFRLFTRLIPGTNDKMLTLLMTFSSKKHLLMWQCADFPLIDHVLWGLGLNKTTSCIFFLFSKNEMTKSISLENNTDDLIGAALTTLHIIRASQQKMKCYFIMYIFQRLTRCHSGYFQERLMTQLGSDL